MLTNEIYNRLYEEVIHPGFCTHCGSCVGLSNGSLGMRETSRGPLPFLIDSKDMYQNSIEACPGRGISYPELNDHIFGQQPQNNLIGNFRQLHIGHSSVDSIRRNGASGGVITQTLIYLLERNLVDGAVVVAMGRPNPWQAEPIIAQTSKEIRLASQSVYFPVPVNALLDKMADFDGNLAYVGLPDQVLSLRKLQKLGHPAAKKVKYILGPYVGTNMYFGAIRSFLRSNGVSDYRNISELKFRAGEWPGHLKIKLNSGIELTAKKFHYNYLIPFFITRSTLFSVDFANELTDISVGDAWHPDYERLGGGYSIVVGRTRKGEELLSDMKDRELLELSNIPLHQALSMHGHMLDFKKRGSFVRLNWQRKLGRRIPDYGYRPAHISFSRKIVEVFITSIFLICSTKALKKFVELLPISIIGPIFNVLRISWKKISKPIKRKGLENIEITLNSFSAITQKSEAS